MEYISDLSWIAQIAVGETLERFTLSGYAVTAVLVPAQRGTTYRYRMLFSQGDDRRPVYAVNLESSILGEWLVTEQIGGGHHIVHRLPDMLSYDQFRILALDRAVTILEKKS